MKKDVMDVDAQITEMMSVDVDMHDCETEAGGQLQVSHDLFLSAWHELDDCRLFRIHRHQAFPEVSLFSKMICGLPKMPDVAETPETQISTPAAQQFQAADSTLNSSSNTSPQSAQEGGETPYGFIE
jgi:hypothetical protein